MNLFPKMYDAKNVPSKKITYGSTYVSLERKSDIYWSPFSPSKIDVSVANLSGTLH